ncbi:unnamed protein product (macronuclear) [Paramecium tetraurelia]|uniref:Uncharacterized protein n=1 Tax=Paramecium tetraurelia TaxID=5888 RepID=A0CK75_PARTE|nr:uncharacterized protein GSPATT00000905001 [Paramecium tetraurelia]CAK71192.1 unnamed protein product [Paramecium tetraurelia]|eukprot:XP_001438589.1 hypothetical protein (macronuclear) [Paramecium tetraurelia strain d4-2]
MSLKNQEIDQQQDERQQVQPYNWKKQIIEEKNLEYFDNYQFYNKGREFNKRNYGVTVDYKFGKVILSQDFLESQQIQFYMNLFKNVYKNVKLAAASCHFFQEFWTQQAEDIYLRINPINTQLISNNQYQQQNTQLDYQLRLNNQNEFDKGSEVIKNESKQQWKNNNSEGNIEQKNEKIQTENQQQKDNNNSEGNVQQTSEITKNENQQQKDNNNSEGNIEYKNEKIYTENQQQKDNNNSEGNVQQTSEITKNENQSLKENINLDGNGEQTNEKIQNENLEQKENNNSDGNVQQTSEITKNEN